MMSTTPGKTLGDDTQDTTARLDRHLAALSPHSPTTHTIRALVSQCRALGYDEAQICHSMNLGVHVEESTDLKHLHPSIMPTSQHPSSPMPTSQHPSSPMPTSQHPSNHHHPEAGKGNPRQEYPERPEPWIQKVKAIDALILTRKAQQEKDQALVAELTSSCASLKTQVLTSIASIQAQINTLLTEHSALVMSCRALEGRVQDAVGRGEQHAQALQVLRLEQQSLLACLENLKPSASMAQSQGLTINTLAKSIPSSSSSSSITPAKAITSSTSKPQSKEAPPSRIHMESDPKLTHIPWVSPTTSASSSSRATSTSSSVPSSLDTAPASLAHSSTKLSTGPWTTPFLKNSLVDPILNKNSSNESLILDIPEPSTSPMQVDDIDTLERSAVLLSPSHSSDKLASPAYPPQPSVSSISFTISEEDASTFSVPPIRIPLPTLYDSPIHISASNVDSNGDATKSKLHTTVKEMPLAQDGKKFVNPAMSTSLALKPPTLSIYGKSVDITGPGPISKNKKRRKRQESTRALVGASSEMHAGEAAHQAKEVIHVNKVAKLADINQVSPEITSNYSLSAASRQSLAPHVNIPPDRAEPKASPPPGTSPSLTNHFVIDTTPSTSLTSIDTLPTPLTKVDDSKSDTMRELYERVKQSALERKRAKTEGATTPDVVAPSNDAAAANAELEEGEILGSEEDDISLGKQVNKSSPVVPETSQWVVGPTSEVVLAAKNKWTVGVEMKDIVDGEISRDSSYRTLANGLKNLDPEQHAKIMSKVQAIARLGNLTMKDGVLPRSVESMMNGHSTFSAYSTSYPGMLPPQPMYMNGSLGMAMPPVYAGNLPFAPPSAGSFYMSAGSRGADNNGQMLHTFTASGMPYAHQGGMHAPMMNAYPGAPLFNQPPPPHPPLHGRTSYEYQTSWIPGTPNSTSYNMNVPSYPSYSAFNSPTPLPTSSQQPRPPSSSSS